MTSPKIISWLVVGGFTLKWMCLRLYVTIWEREIPGSSQVELLLCLAVVPPLLCCVLCVPYSTVNTAPSCAPLLCPWALSCSVPCCALCCAVLRCAVLCFAVLCAVPYSKVQYKKLQNPKIWFKIFQGIDWFWFSTHMSHRWFSWTSNETENGRFRIVPGHIYRHENIEVELRTNADMIM
jgi:hypothetical protein